MRTPCPKLSLEKLYSNLLSLIVVCLVSNIESGFVEFFFNFSFAFYPHGWFLFTQMNILKFNHLKIDIKFMIIEQFIFMFLSLEFSLSLYSSSVYLLYCT